MTEKQEGRQALYTAPAAAGSDPAGHGDELRELAREIAAELAELEPDRGKELLGSFVSELFLSFADEGRRRANRRRQAEGIAKAKAKGVRFGPAARPLPDNFAECFRAWQAGRMTAVDAAKACGITRQMFYRSAARMQDAV